MKQTAVEWLFEKLWNTDKDKFTWYAILNQAKAMEKEQMKNASCPYIGGWEDDEFEHWYNETFKNWKQ